MNGLTFKPRRSEILANLKLFTIGFTQKGAELFFRLLRESGVRRIVDVRLNNLSQLAGFAKRDDLKYFAKELCNIEYTHIPDLAPTKEILEAYKKHERDWSVYEEQFFALMENRAVEKSVKPVILDGDCLLCSEHKPDHCHRRLVAEYLNEKWGGTIPVTHLY